MSITAVVTVVIHDVGGSETKFTRAVDHHGLHGNPRFWGEQFAEAAERAVREVRTAVESVNGTPPERMAQKLVDGRI